MVKAVLKVPVKEGMKLPDGIGVIPVLVGREAALRTAFDAKKAELAGRGMSPGRLITDYPAAAGFEAYAQEQVYETYTLVAFNLKVFVIYGAIRDKWASFGGRNWGTPTTDELDAGLGAGRYNLFRLQKAGPGGGRNAAIYWSNVTGANDIAGLAYDKFVADGGVQFYGFPTTGTWPTAGADGFFVHFKRVYKDDALASIYVPRNWKQAWGVYGAIREVWEKLNWEHSALGYPKGDEFGPYDGPNPERRQYFEGGTMIWRPDAGAFVETPDYHVRYRGLHVVAKGSDQNSANAEYYFFVGAIPRVRPDQVTTTKLPKDAVEYGALRTGRWRHDNVVVYSGASDSLMLSLTGAERDLGDPNVYLALIQDGTKKAVGTAITALGALLGGAGAAVGGTVGAPLSDALGGELGKVINDVLDTGDDPLNSVAVSLGIQTLRTYLDNRPTMAPARTGDGQAAAPIPYHFIVRMNGGGHQLDLFFEVVRGRA